MTSTVNKDLVKEFAEKLRKIDNEMDLLKIDKRDLFLEYKEKLDVKAFRAALQISKIKAKVNNHTALDEILGTLEDYDD